MKKEQKHWYRISKQSNSRLIMVNTLQIVIIKVIAQITKDRHEKVIKQWRLALLSVLYIALYIVIHVYMINV